MQFLAAEAQPVATKCALCCVDTYCSVAHTLTLVYPFLRQVTLDPATYQRVRNLDSKGARLMLETATVDKLVVSLQMHTGDINIYYYGVTFFRIPEGCNAIVEAIYVTGAHLQHYHWLLGSQQQRWQGDVDDNEDASESQSAAQATASRQISEVGYSGDSGETQLAVQLLNVHLQLGRSCCRGSALMTSRAAGYSATSPGW